MLVAVGLDVVVGVAARVAGERRSRLDGERVDADVRRRRVEGEHALERRAPVGVALAGAAVDEVDVVASRKPVRPTSADRSLDGARRSCARPRLVEHVADAVDCTPSEMRVTPASGERLEESARRRSRGCTRRVTSAPGPRARARRGSRDEAARRGAATASHRRGRRCRPARAPGVLEPRRSRSRHAST